MGGTNREVEIPPSLEICLKVRGLPVDGIKKVAKSPGISEKVEENDIGVRYIGCGWLDDNRRVTLEYVDLKSRESRLVLDAIVGIWNQ